MDGFMAVKDRELGDLFLDTLKDIYFAEKQILSALPKMMEAAQSPTLKAAFEKHLAETGAQVKRLEQVFGSIARTPEESTCDAIVGIIEESTEIMDEYKGVPAIDAGLLAAAQAVGHYEISRYGTLKQWAIQLGHRDSVKLLDTTLKEQKKFETLLENLVYSNMEVRMYADGTPASALAYEPGRSEQGLSDDPDNELATDDFSPEDWIEVKNQALKLIGAKFLDSPDKHLAYIRQRLPRAYADGTV
jgi:ferritin-like metal-binding protein YciE